MFLRYLSLSNFRSFQDQTFAFSKETTLILGPNTSGKTNILEAIYLLSTGRSFRAEVEKEMITWGEELARIKGVTIEGVTFNGVTNFSLLDNRLKSVTPEKAVTPETGELEILITTGTVAGKKVPQKKYLVNAIPRRMIDFVGNLRIVLFWPEDLELITNSPSRRRKYLDLVLSQVDRDYRRCLLSYEKGLRQRNKLLERIREEGANPSQLLFWDQLLIKNGAVLTKERGELIEFINGARHSGEDPPAGGDDSRIGNGFWTSSSTVLSSLPKGQNDGESRFQLEYDKSIISPARLEQYSDEEVAAGATLVGPHRDDVKFKASEGKGNVGRDLSLYGSRGEQRLAILWLKLAELEFITKKTGERPLLLLDDIFSELDEGHRKDVLKLIPKQQTIITTTDLHLLEKEYLKEVKMIELE